MPKMDRLTSQLYYLPSIIERLGLGIAEAQKGLNADYVDNVARLMELIEGFVAKGAFASAPDGEQDEDKAKRIENEKKARELMILLLKKLGPSKYQFSKTTLQFRADLSESRDIGGTAGVGLGLGAVMVNASAAMGFASDYQAAAEITTVLTAIPMSENDELLSELLKNADSMTKLDKPAQLAAVDKEIFESLGEVTKLTGVKLEEPANAGAGQGAEAGAGGGPGGL